MVEGEEEAQAREGKIRRICPHSDRHTGKRSARNQAYRLPLGTLTCESRNPCISPPQGPDRLVSVPFARPWVLEGRGTPPMCLSVPRAWHREGTLIKVVLN